MKIRLIVFLSCFVGLVFFNNFADAATNSQIITIKNGWNIISTPRIVESHNFSIEENSSNFDIYILDPSSASNWSTMAQLNQTEFTPLFGYFINNKTGFDQTLTLNYKQDVPPNERLFSRDFLIKGWYSIGIANPSYSIKQYSVISTDTNNPSRILNSFNGNYSSVLDFTKDNFISNPDSVSLGNIWDNKTEGDINELNDFRDLKGYAIYINNPDVNYEGFQNNDDTEDIIKTAGELLVTANTANVEKVVVLSAAEPTTDVELAKVDFKAESNSLTLKTLKATVTSTGEIDESLVMPTIKLYDGTTLLSAQTVADGGVVVFDSLTIAIAKDTTKTLTFKGNFNKIATGFGQEAATVIVALTGVTQTEIIAEDANYDTVTTGNITATTAIGKKVYTYTKAPTVTLVSTSISATPDKANKEADATITFKIKANGGDIYLNDYDTATGATHRAITGASTDNGAEVVTYTFTSADATHDAVHHYYTVRNGEEKTFTLTVHTVSGGAGFYKSWVAAFRWGTVSTLEADRMASTYAITTLGLENLITNALNLTAS